MPERIPKSVAKKVVFRAIASSDHFTPATGKTIAITISKNAGAFANPAAGATNATEISSGFYAFDLGTGDTGTSGPLAWRGAGTGIDDVGDVYEVVAATNGGFSALPDTACTTNASLITAGTGTSQLSVSSGAVIIQAGTGTGQLDFTSGVVKANVTQYNGVAATSSGGRPEVNTTHIAGTAWASTTLFTLASHDPGATIGTSTLTQTQVTGGAYALNSASFAFNAALDLSTTMKASVTTAATAATPTAAAVTGNVGGNVVGSVGSVTGNVGGNVVGSVASVTARVTANTDQLAGQTVTAAAGVTFPTSVASPTNITAGTITTATNVTTVNGLAANVITAASIAADAGAEIADAVWDEAISGHLTAGTTGASLNAAGAAGDPWSTALPGAYGAGSAGYIVGTNLDTTVGSRSSLDAAGIRTAVGLASANLDTQLTAIDDYLDTEVAAIKAKTDALPASPAATGDIPTAGAIADAVWDEAYAGHSTSGTFGLALRAADQRGERVVARGTATTGASTTSIPTSAFSPAGAAADQFRGRIVIFDLDTTTAALRGQATDITASSNSSTPTLTVTALTTAPSSGDTFSVV